MNYFSHFPRPLLEGGLHVKRKDRYAFTEHGKSMVILGTSSQMNDQLVILGSFLTKQRGETLHIRYIVEVPRSLPLMAVLAREMEQADNLLNTAREIAQRFGCKVHAAVIQARDAGEAILDEVKEWNCSLLLLGMIPHRSGGLGKIAPHVLPRVPCRTWVLCEPKPCPDWPVAESLASRSQEYQR